MRKNKHLLSLIIICLILVLNLASCAITKPAPVDDQNSGQTQEQSDVSDSEEPAADDGTAAEDTPSDPAADDGLISEEDAIAIVLERVDGATAGNIVSFQKEYDDGVWQYEGSLIYNGIEYEFEIDARDGTLLDWEIDD